jgi:hypothetical protein
MPDDQTTREVQHYQIRIGALFPVEQQASITIEPAMRPLGDPASRSPYFTLCLSSCSLDKQVFISPYRDRLYAACTTSGSTIFVFFRKTGLLGPFSQLLKVSSS